MCKNVLQCVPPSMSKLNRTFSTVALRVVILMCMYTNTNSCTIIGSVTQLLKKECDFWQQVNRNDRMQLLQLLPHHWTCQCDP